MITMPVLQFVFLLIALVILTMWLMSKVFIIACTQNETTLKHVLLQVWQKKPDTLQAAMHSLMTQEEADIMVQSSLNKCMVSNNAHLASILQDHWGLTQEEADSIVYSVAANKARLDGIVPPPQDRGQMDMCPYCRKPTERLIEKIGGDVIDAIRCTICDVGWYLEKGDNWWKLEPSSLRDKTTQQLLKDHSA